LGRAGGAQYVFSPENRLQGVLLVLDFGEWAGYSAPIGKGKVKMRAALGVVVLVILLVGLTQWGGSGLVATPVENVPQVVPARAQVAAPAPDRDGYLLLAVSWTPSWCEREGDARSDSRCAAGANSGWLVHGLWPQNDDGTWPEFCDSPHAPPSRQMTGAMVDVMGAGGLAAYQWRKHGSCSELSPKDYFAATRAAFGELRLPDATKMAGRVRPAEVLDALRAANPAIGTNMAIATCGGGLLQEVRLCLTHDLRPRACDAAVLARACRSNITQVPPIR
jgi:ribonuclease T2